jgi:DNA-binding NarL/FixJ family response regulator
MRDISMLTGREQDVLRRISKGESTKQIARVLAISPATVRSHVQNVYVKLGVRTRAQAAAVVVDARLAAAIGPCPADVVGAHPRAQYATGDCLAPPPAPFDALTRREVEVLRCIAAGIPRRAIAERLVLSPNTVRTHARNVLAKLGVHSSIAAAALLRRAMCAAAG